MQFVSFMSCFISILREAFADRIYICLSGSNLFAFAKAGLRYVIVESVCGLVVTEDMLLCHEKK